MDSVNTSTRRVTFAGFKNYFSEKMNYSLYSSIVTLIVVCVSLYNLSQQTGDQQLWRDLLLFAFGLVIPLDPKNNKN